MSKREKNEEAVAFCDLPIGAQFRFSSDSIPELARWVKVSKTKANHPAQMSNYRMFIKPDREVLP